MSKLSLANKAGIIGLGRFLRALGKLLLAIIIVRLLSKFDYGTYRQIFMLYSLFSIIFFLGLPTSVYYFVPRINKEDSKTFIIQSEVLLFLLGIVLGVIFLITSNYWGKSFTNETLPDYLKLFALYPLLDFPIQTLPPILICYEKHKIAAIANIIFTITFVFSILTPLLLGYSLFHSFLILIIVSAIQLIVVFIYILKLIGGFSKSFNLKLLLKQLKYSVPLGISGIITILSRELDKLIISFYFIPQIFAVYAVGARELPFVAIIPYAVSSTLFPKFVALYEKNNKEEFLSLWHKAIKKVSIIILPLFPFFLITAKDVVSILYTKNYLESVPIFRIYLLLLLIHITAFDSVVLSMGFSKLVLLGSLLALVLNVIFNIIFIKIIGFWGPAIATILVSFLLTFYFMKIIKNKINTTWYEIFPWKKYFFTLLASVISGVLVLPLMLLYFSPVIKIIILSITFLVVYIFILLIFKIIDKDDLEFIKRWITLKAIFG